VNSDRIVLANGMRFGFGYKLIGEPKGTVVKVKTVTKYPAPGVFNQAKGMNVMMGEIERERPIGGDDQYMGFVVGNAAANLPVGNWTMELWHGVHKLVEKTFVVSRR
jgi:hypothetical protein